MGWNGVLPNGKVLVELLKPWDYPPTGMLLEDLAALSLSNEEKIHYAAYSALVCSMTLYSEYMEQ